MLSSEKRRFLEKWAVAGKTFKRDAEDEIAPFIGASHAVFLYGPRRSGKSTLAKRLLSKQPGRVEKRYVNFEEPGFSDVLDYRLLDEFTEGFGKEDVVVLDEVQQVSGWEKWVRRCVDLKLFKMIVTGSSAKLLSSEFATAIGGRGVGFQVLPLSFKEFKRVAKKPFASYLESGGYPEIVLKPEEKEKLLESYLEQALMRDVVVRYNLRQASEIRNLTLYLLTNAGTLTSLKQLRLALNSSYDTLRQFIEYLESAFLVFQTPFFAYSMKESLARPRKVYAWDTGMQAYASKSLSRDLGRKAENAVAVELKRRGFEVFYWKGRREVDLVAKKGLDVLPINICYAKTLPPREFEGLIEFGAEHKKRSAMLLHLGETKVTEKEGVTITLKNMEEWLLEGGRREEKVA